MADLFGQASHDPGCKQLYRWPTGSEIAAEFSPCDQFRWSLTETWDATLPLWLWLLMNPSGAGLQFSDATVSKTGQISRQGGAGGQIITNSGAYRSTDPAGLAAAPDPIGPENEATILRLAATAGKVIVAYGQPPKVLRGEGLRLARLLHARGIPLHVLRLSQDGTPMHPLSRGKGFIPITTTPCLWTPPPRGSLTR